MDIGLELGVVKHDLVIENDLIALLSVLVARHDLESDTTRHWREGQLELLTSFILFGTFFAQLQKLPTRFVHKLYIKAVVHILTPLVCNKVLIVEHFVLLSLLEDAEPLHELLVELLVVLE